MREREVPAAVLVDKPVGPTSHDIVRTARVALGIRRVGHAGTLDPFATGLLILCCGRATRLVEYLHRLPKTYVATARLGIDTDTEDHTGSPIARSDAWRDLASDDIERAAAGLVGAIEQRPPSFSARRVGGRRAHEAARAGESLELSAREVVVHELTVTGLEPPHVTFTARVSTGTYVRSLARDLGRDLGCGAHLTALRRKSIGPFRVEDAADVRELEGGDLVPPAALSAPDLLSWMPRRRLSAAEAREVEHGRPIPAGGPDFAAQVAPDEPIALVAGERLVGVGFRLGDELRPRKVFGAGG